MDFYLTTKPGDSLLKKNVAHVVNWVTWGIRAFGDAVADDVDDVYQGQVAIFASAAIALWFAVPILCTQVWGLTIWKSILCAFAAYLLLGALYHLNNRQWKM